MSDTLFELAIEPYTVPNYLLGTDAIDVQPCELRELVRLQAVMGKGPNVWKPSPGRQMAFTVTHDDDIIGLLLLSSTVLNLGPRDRALDLPKDAKLKGKELRHYMDLAVCIAAQPLGWHWNIGKLIAMLATTLGPEYEAKYGDELKGITTTSLWGKSSQYNRVYQFLGYTSGHGHMHISEEDYARMRNWLEHNDPAKLARLTNARKDNKFGVCIAYCESSGDKSITTYHGHRRGIYYHPVSTTPRDDVIREWFDRWGHPRYLRTLDADPPYTEGMSWTKEQLV